ncbi:hypothetical protein ACVNPZ_05750 [Staphylococcus aureus]
MLLTVVVQLGTTTLLNRLAYLRLTLFAIIIVTWILLFAGIKHDKVDA